MAGIAHRMEASKGQVSWATQKSSGLLPNLPIHPVNGEGHLLAQIPMEGGVAWFAGATYVTSASPDLSVAEHHAANFARLKKLCPQAAESLQVQFNSGDLRAWQGLRYGCADRMPVVGRINGKQQPPLCMVTGFGSRGLSWSTLCAELLAADLSGEPLPLEGRLADCMTSQRFETR